jgi:hypothetical protein
MTLPTTAHLHLNPIGVCKMTKTIFETFPGIMVLDAEPVEICNPFSGETAVLDPEAVAVYDYLKGCELIGDHVMLRKALEWFMENHPEEYMTLLD